MKCSSCGRSANFLTAVITRKDTKLFCTQLKCSKARVELEKMVEALKRGGK